MMNNLTENYRRDILKPDSKLTIRTLNLEERHLWNSLARSVPFGCFMQSRAWADFKEMEGYKTFIYGLFAGQELVGGCLFYYYPHAGKTNLLFATGGPILPPRCAEEGMRLLVEKAAVLAKEIGAIALRIEPLWHEKPDYIAEFVRAPADLLPSETLLIDLRPSEAEILAAMKPKGRYNLRLSWRHGVETEFTATNLQAIPIFYDIFWETVQRQQFFGEPYGFFINLCQTLFAANMAEIGLATWRGKVLAAILVVYWGDSIGDRGATRATYLYGGSSFQHREVMAPYSLHWAAMQRAKARGCTVYDFYGFTGDRHHSYAKFSQFKSQFGGVSVKTIGAHDYFFYDRLADTLISLLRNIGG